MRRAVFGSLLFLAACSSDGNGDGATPTPTPGPNSPPSFTSAATASVAENTALAYQASATDPEGNPITFSITGGADQARFTISAAGALSFAANPNFELPADADGNNIYAVQLRASDGTANATLDLQVTVTNSREGIAVRRVGTGFDQPIDVAAVPGDNSRVLVAEKTGGVWFLTPSTGAKALAFRVTGLTTENERGLLGIAPSPNYATTGEVMVHMTGTAGTIFIRQCFVPGGACNDVLSIPHPTNSNHNGGWIAWGPDGNLYVAAGDGGGGAIRTTMRRIPIRGSARSCGWRGAARGLRRGARQSIRSGGRRSLCLRARPQESLPQFVRRQPDHHRRCRPERDRRA
ncbi:PQQ-dependent sugar dehydrogenase [Sphingomonas sp. 7/4-4]|uniref:PQQ-dependent sugar dehydrogenase n=1 Tax=Sphingomonas sp. 7/4-4 TaxID=3018446 RepID=UPI0022F3C946|nr:PQQ-dependent sugar dehydrogenase [Sphingomonas sp. 7/4-4]WBY09649.1 PQQ-dependent sugar dehydrogenase [Sphingomonas sp. 7/4-4]